jgi:hypothetical protein
MSNFQAIRAYGPVLDEDAVFYPLTAPMRTSIGMKVRFVLWLNADGVRVAPGLQFSYDGIHWLTSDGTMLGIAGTFLDDDPPTQAWISAADRTYIPGWFTLPLGFSNYGDAPNPLETLPPYVRFGVFACTTSGTVARGGVASLQVEVQQAGEVGRVSAAGVGIPTEGGTATLFTPLTGTVSATQAAYARVSWQIDGDSGVINTGGKVRTWPGYQTTIDGGLSWSSPTALTQWGDQEGNGVVYPEGFALIGNTVGPEGGVRFGLFTENIGGSSDTAVRTVLASLLVEWRS